MVRSFGCLSRICDERRLEMRQIGRRPADNSCAQTSLLATKKGQKFWSAFTLSNTMQPVNY